LPVLAYVLDSCLRLLHPFMPFLTEAIWQDLRGRIAWAEEEAIIVARWPRVQRAWIDREAEAKAQLIVEVVRAVRNIRAERGVDADRYVEAYVAADGARPLLEAARPFLESLARVRPLHLVADTSAAPQAGVASAVLAGAQVILPLAHLVDREAERARLSKQLQEAKAEVHRLEGKLANEAFRDRAPREVVAREEERLAAARARLEGLEQRLAELR